MRFHIQTDHKPLVPLFSSKNLEDLPLRVQRFRMRMMRFQFTISHVPGKELTIADALSRAPAGTPSERDELLQLETTAYVDFVIRHLPATEQRITEIRECQEADEVLQQIEEYCRSGWPEKSSLPPELKPYYPVAAELTVQNGLILRGGRMVIPPPMRKDVLRKIHTGHQGITKCRERARQSVWWPGLSKQLEGLVHSCEDCLRAQRQRPQPLSPTPLPDLPWQKVASDLFEWNQAVYLLVVDYFSRYIEIARLQRPTTTEVVTHLKSIFARHGVPETLVSDNGPQYASREFSEFAKDYEFRHITSSPYYPQANGEAERAIGTIKRLLKKEGDPYKALLAYRSTPLQTGYSPSQLLMGRILRTSVPTTREQRRPRIPDLRAVRRRDKESKRRQKTDFDSRHGARELPPLQPGDRVWIPARQTEGEVQREVAPQSYEVEQDEGSLRRNRRDLIRLPSSEEDQSESSDYVEQSDSSESTSNESNSTESNSNAQPTLRRSSRTSQPPERLDPSWSN
jgi:transposase InsO family protein